MEQQAIIERLKEKTQTAQVYKNVLTMWAKRQRARNIVTLQGLKARMEKAGYQHSDNEYVGFLKELALMGIGRLEVKPGTRQVKALSNIKNTLQSIGEAALGQKLEFEAFKQRNRYEKVVARTEQFKAAAAERDYPVSLTVMINGKPVNFRVPKELTTAEIAELVHRFRG